MCLYTDSKYPFTTKEDIVVYKILDENLRSPYQDFQYELNKEYINEDEKEITEHYRFPIAIGAGYFHAFRTSEFAKNCLKNIYIWRKVKLKLFKAIIPKDSNCYIDAYREQICGDRIKIIEEIKIK